MSQQDPTSISQSQPPANGDVIDTVTQSVPLASGATNSSDIGDTPTATDAQVVKPESKKVFDDVTKILIGQMVEDSLAIISSNLHSYVTHDTNFIDEVIRYLYKTSRHKHTPAVFQQAFAHNMWTPIKELAVEEPNCKLLFAQSAEIAKSFVQKNLECVMMVVDFAPTTAPLLNLRLNCVLTLYRHEAARQPKPAKISTKDYITMQARNSVLIPQQMRWSINNMALWATDGQEVMQSILDEALNRRTQVANAFADSLFVKDVRSACALWKIHKKIIENDKGKEKKDLPPMNCVRISCGGGGSAHAEQYNQEGLGKMISVLDQSNPSDPLLATYRSAVEMMKIEREPNQAVVIVVRSHDGPICTSSSVMFATMDMAEMSKGVEEEAEAGKEKEKKAREELEAMKKQLKGEQSTTDLAVLIKQQQEKDELAKIELESAKAKKKQQK